MTENKKTPYLYVFWLEFAFALVIPVVLCWATTPTSILNSNSLFKLLETIGICGLGLIFFAGIPVGVIGIIKAKRMVRLRNTTIVLSIINLLAGIIEILMLLLVFYAVVFRGISH